MQKRFYGIIVIVLASIFVSISGCSNERAGIIESNDAETYSEEISYIAVNDNIPEFTENEIVTDSFEQYSELDSLGRCGVAMACVGQDLMPTEDRGSIGQVKPSGWHTVKYDCVDGKYLYNRCHLIGYQLSGENANEKNLITGTRYLNIEGMLPFENEVADYVKDTGNHVMYRVTPEFEGADLVARGVEIEAWSVEDKGEGVCFHVFAYNIQPGVEVDYATGESWLKDEIKEDEEEEQNREYTDEEKGTQDYMINVNTKKFHNPDCSSIIHTKEENKESFNGPRQWLVEHGYEPCGNCNP